MKYWSKGKGRSHYVSRVLSRAKVSEKTDKVVFWFLTVQKVDAGDLAADILVDLSSDSVQPILDLLLDDGTVQMTSQKNFLVSRRIWVIGRALSCNQSVHLADHEAIESKAP